MIRSRKAKRKIILLEGEVFAPTSCLDFGIRHEEQVRLIANAQDKILALQGGEVGLDSGPLRLM